MMSYYIIPLLPGSRRAQRLSGQKPAVNPCLQVLTVFDMYWKCLPQPVAALRLSWASLRG